MRGELGFPVRLRFSERGPVRFISHRDVARAFERAFRVLELPLAFSKGFTPHPKVGFGLALPVGHESDAEYLDVELMHDPGVDSVPQLLTAALPEGIEVTGVTALAQRAPSLQEAVTAVEYRVEVSSEAPDSTAAAMEAAIAAALGSPTLEVRRTRKGRDVIDDVRPAIRELALLDEGEVTVLLGLELSTQPRGTRPGEVIAALNAVTGGSGATFAERRVLRTHQWIERGGARLEPLEADPRVRVPEVRAS